MDIKKEDSGFARVEIFMDRKKLTPFLKKLNQTKLTGVTVFQAMGCGIQKGSYEYVEEAADEIQLLPQLMVLIICERSEVPALIELAKLELYTGHIGDGKIFVSRVDEIVRVRTGEEGRAALQESSLA